MNPPNPDPRGGDSNPAESPFCTHCGHPLTEPKRGEPPKAPADIVAANRAGIEYEALNAVKQKALEWMKWQVAGITLSVALLAYLGLSTFWSWEKQVAEFQKLKEQSLHQITNSLTDSTQRMALIVKNLTNAVQDSQNEIGRLSNSVTTTMYGLLTSASNSLTEIDKQREAIDSKVQRILGDLTTTERLKHSFMDLFVEFQGNSESVSLFKQKSLKNLADEGFVVKDQYIARLNLDKSEVVYFHKSAEPEAVAIATVLTNQYRNIESRLYNRPERGPREILIKLKEPN